MADVKASLSGSTLTVELAGAVPQAVTNTSYLSYPAGRRIPSQAPFAIPALDDSNVTYVLKFHATTGTAGTYGQQRTVAVGKHDLYLRALGFYQMDPSDPRGGGCVLDSVDAVDTNGETDVSTQFPDLPFGKVIGKEA